MDSRIKISEVAIDNERSLTCIFWCPTAPGQTKTIWIILCDAHTHPEASIWTKPPWVTPCTIWPRPYPFRAYYSQSWFFPTITTEKLSNFWQALKVPDRVNWIKAAFSQYDENSSFGILTAPFIRANLPITTRVLQFSLSPAIRNISENIYSYCPRHCANGGLQIKDIDFDQSSSTA